MRSCFVIGKASHLQAVFLWGTMEQRIWQTIRSPPSKILFSNPTTDAQKDLEVVITILSAPSAYIIQYETGLWDPANGDLPGPPVLLPSVAKLRGEAHTHRKCAEPKRENRNKTGVSQHPRGLLLLTKRHRWANRILGTKEETTKSLERQTVATRQGK